MMLVVLGKNISFLLLFLVTVKFIAFAISFSIPCSCVQIRNWFDYRNHICIVSTVTFI